MILKALFTIFFIGFNLLFFILLYKNIRPKPYIFFAFLFILGLLFFLNYKFFWISRNDFKQLLILFVAIIIGSFVFKMIDDTNFKGNSQKEIVTNLPDFIVKNNSIRKLLIYSLITIVVSLNQIEIIWKIKL